MPDCHTGDATAPRRSSSWAGGRTHPAHCVTEASSCTYWPATPTRKRAGAADLSLKLTDMVDTRAVASRSLSPEIANRKRATLMAVLYSSPTPGEQLSPGQFPHRTPQGLNPFHVESM